MGGGAIDMGRDPSSLTPTRFIEVRIFKPVSVVETLSSFPIDHTKTLGWFRSLPDHVFELRQTVRVRRQHACLAEHQHPEFIAGIQQLRSRRVVRGPDAVAAHLL